MTSSTRSGWSVTRRQPVSAVWGGYASSLVRAAAPAAGTVQPRAAVPAPRRYPARAVWHGTAPVAVNAPPPIPVTVQLAHGFISSRRPVGGLTGGVSTPPVNASGPPGSAQPRAAVPVPRRAASRAVVRWSAPAKVNAPPVSGTVPDHLVIARRNAARGVWRGLAVPPAVAEAVTGRGSVSRRASARALWRAILGALNASGPSGRQQPRAAVPVPRRTVSRGLWHAQAGPANAHGPAGDIQPKPVIGRRAPARAVWAGTTVRTVNGSPNPPVNGTVQPHPVVARRSAARAFTAGVITRTVNTVPPPAGTVQPSAAVPRHQHPPQRVVWRGGAVPGQQPKAATGGLVRRRATTRGLWHGGTGPGNATSPAGSQPGGRVVTRRPPNRGQWRGTTARTVNAQPVAVPAPRQQLTVPRRASARARWQGTITPGQARAAPAVDVLFTAGRGRVPWTAGRARLPWTTGRARLPWTTGRTRNS